MNVGRCSSFSVCCFPSHDRWTWKKTAALSVVLAVIAASVTYASGLSSVEALCGIGGGALLIPFMVKIAKQEKTVEIEGFDHFDLEKNQAAIVSAIKSGTTLSWKGKVESDDEIAILPGLSIGKRRKDETRTLIEFTPFKDGERWVVAGAQAVTTAWEQPVKKYYLEGGTCQFNHCATAGNQQHAMERCVEAGLIENHAFLITAEDSEFIFSHGTKVDVGIVLIRFLHGYLLRHDPTLALVDVRNWVEKQLGCVYGGELHCSNWEHPTRIEDFLKNHTAN